SSGIGPNLGPRVDLGDQEGVGWEGVFARLERILPHADAAYRHDRRLQSSRVPLRVGEGVAFFRLVRLERTKVDIGINVRLDDADIAGLDFLRVRLRNIPQIAVDAPFAGSENGQLRTALAAVVEKRRGVEHLIPVSRRERIRDRLPGAQRRAVASRGDAALPPWDRRLPFSRLHPS